MDNPPESLLFKNGIFFLEQFWEVIRKKEQIVVVVTQLYRHVCSKFSMQV